MKSKVNRFLNQRCLSEKKKHICKNNMKNLVISFVINLKKKSLTTKFGVC